MDVFGNVWQWYVLEREREEDEDEEGSEGHEIRRRVIFTWDGGYSSLVPPKFGKDDSYYQFGY